MRQPRGTAIVVGFGSEDKFLRLDLKTARVTKLTDDKGTDLLAGVNMAGKIRCEILGKNVNVEFHTPIVPAEGATKLHFEAEFSVVVEHDGKETVKGMGITTDVGVGF